jgi:hypothetical protein
METQFNNKEKEYMINYLFQLNGLSTLPFIRSQAIGKIRLSGNMKNHPNKEYFEKELNKQYYSCGCDTGAIGLLIGLVLGLGYSVYKYIKSDWSITDILISTFLSLFIMSGIGKICGLYVANKKLKVIIKEIKKQWIPEKEYNEDKSHCG